MATDEDREGRIKTGMLMNGLLLVAGGLLVLFVCLGQDAPWYGYAGPLIFLAGGGGLLLWRKRYKYPRGW
jgi:hypothetical protein